MDALNELFSLKGHIGLVTGASSGLGIECAHALALAGADVAVAARRGERLERFAAELTRSYEVKALGVRTDITSDTGLDQLIDTVQARLGLVDILVNNAGISPTGRAEALPRETWDAALATNLTAPMMLAQRVARRLIEARKPGRIINMISIYGLVASSIYRLSAYTATKGGLANLTRQLAIEWAPYGILVNAIAPGWIPTEATEAGMAKPQNRERMEKATPLGRLGHPQEIRGTVIYLASQASSYVTGTILSIDGGYVAW
ncbi:MAG: SDR family oxidoreductase [Deltaproteobacteria bacterium]|nr:SDR family oxidoreductase [Deltaproteobacteria bacterium]